MERAICGFSIGLLDIVYDQVQIARVLDGVVRPYQVTLRGRDRGYTAVRKNMPLARAKRGHSLSILHLVEHDYYGGTSEGSTDLYTGAPMYTV
jgi:hypothetical protein